MLQKTASILLFLFLVLHVLAGSAYNVDTSLVHQGEILSVKKQTAKSLLMLNRFVDMTSSQSLSHSDSLLLLRALSCNAQNYQVLGNVHQSLGYFKRAIDIAKRLGERRRLAVLYNNLFGIYYQQHEYEQAEDLLGLSLAINKEIRDTIATRNNYNNFGLISLDRKDYTKALHYYNLALTFTPRADRVGRSLILTNRADLYDRMGRYSAAEQELSKAIELQNGVSIDARTIQTMLNMTLLKAHLGKTAEAKSLQPAIYRALPHLPLATRANSLAQLADVHFILGDSIGALRDILAYQSVKDSLDRATNTSQLQQLLVAYDTERLKQSNDHLQQAADFYRLSARHRMVVAYCVAFILLLVVALAVLLYRRWRSDKAKSRLISEQQERLLSYEQAEHERRQRELTSEIDHKNRQLTTYNFDLASINEFHGRISQALAEFMTHAHDEESTKVLHDIMRRLQHFNDKPLGDDFRIYFDEVHPGFLRILGEQYRLSKTDLRLCAYLYLGMTTKEIAALTYKEVRSVESSRNRLRKKLELPAGSDLHEFFARVAEEAKNAD